MQQVCCGASHCIAVASTGDVYSWGYGGMGATGHGRDGMAKSSLGEEGSPCQKSGPRLVSCISGVVRIVQASAGLAHTLLLSGI